MEAWMLAEYAHLARNPEPDLMNPTAKQLRKIFGLLALITADAPVLIAQTSPESDGIFNHVDPFIGTAIMSGAEPVFETGDNKTAFWKERWNHD
jgi:hypothetical protein